MKFNGETQNDPKLALYAFGSASERDFNDTQDGLDKRDEGMI